MTSLISNGMKLAMGVFLLLGGSQVSVNAQSGAGSACAVSKKGYTCNRAAFQIALKAAKTVRVETPSMDRNGHAQLEELVREMGKTVQPKGEPADLTFVLVPTDPEGMKMDSGDAELAILSVYAPGVDGKHGPLMWSETFAGSADMRWPEVLHGLIRQFRVEFAVQ